MLTNPLDRVDAVTGESGRCPAARGTGRARCRPGGRPSPVVGGGGPDLCGLPPRGRSARRPHRRHHRRDPRLPPLPRAEGRGGSRAPGPGAAGPSLVGCSRAGGRQALIVGRTRRINWMPRAQEAVTAIWLGLVVLGAGRLHAQGVTGAAMQGTITGADSAVVQDANVLITNTATGERWRTATNAKGRFFVEHLSVGGPYRVEVHAIGFAPASQDGILLSLGERLHHRLQPSSCGGRAGGADGPGGGRSSHQLGAHRAGPDRLRLHDAATAVASRLHRPGQALPAGELRELRAVVRRPARSAERAAGGRHHQQRPLQHDRDRERHHRGVPRSDDPDGREPRGGPAS